MKNHSDLKRERFYTQDHEWIDFQGSLAYVGVCAFKLTGFRKIKRVEFEHSNDLLKAGDVLATIFSVEYKITIHMPMDGEIFGYNDELSGGDPDILIHQPENKGWIAVIFPSFREERKDLLLPDQYLLKIKRFTHS